MLLADRPDLLDALRPFGRTVGTRVEIDLEALSSAHPSLCRALEEYQSQTTSLWAKVQAGAASGTPYVVARRAIVDASQITTKSRRADLREQLADLRTVPGAAAVIEAVTDVSYDADHLVTVVDAAGGDVAEPEPGHFVVTIPLEGAGAWPLTLGGPATSTEVARHVRVTVRHGKGQERAVRALRRVEVLVDELWADPATAAARLEAA